jgi:hypothetical protein
VPVLPPTLSATSLISDFSLTIAFTPASSEAGKQEGDNHCFNRPCDERGYRALSALPNGWLCVEAGDRIWVEAEPGSVYDPIPEWYERGEADEANCKFARAAAKVRLTASALVYSRSGCRRFCSCQSSKNHEVQQLSTSGSQEVQYQSLKSSKFQQISTRFLNVIRDQEVYPAALAEVL